ncbi:MAG: M14 family metallopeptidase [Burkholderiales bacterium]
MSAAAGFAATYGEARQKFLAAARARGLALRHHVHPVAKGAQGEDLAIDVAVLGDPAAREVLLLTAGTHGAEGFCGSGCEIGLLADDAFVAQALRDGVRVVFLHALNPFGFSHLRRTNEDNVDLNRNFRDWSVPALPNRAYADVHGFMVPATWPPSPADDAALGAYLAAHGERTLQQAVSSGQSEFPDGLFYAGVRAAWSNGVLRRVLREEAAGARALAWIDYHTALGPRGHGEMIYNGGPHPEDIARTKAIWGPAVTSFYDGSSTSAALTGINGHAARDECPGVAYAGIALEFGTLPVLAVLQALRADQWLANHPDAPAEQRAAIKRAVRDAFYQDADDWKAMLHAQSLARAREALAGLVAGRAGAGA